MPEGKNERSYAERALETVKISIGEWVFDIRWQDYGNCMVAVRLKRCIRIDRESETLGL